MNLFFRLFIVSLKAILTKHIGVLDKSVTKFRVWPWDCDINWHLTNSRYLSFMDLARVKHIGAIRVLLPMLKRRWLPVANACELSFILPIPPLSTIDLVTRIVAWDEKYFYFEHRFEVKGKLYAIGYVKKLMRYRDQRICTKELLQLIGEDMPSPELSEVIKRWQNLIVAKRDQEKKL